VTSSRDVRRTMIYFLRYAEKSKTSYTVYNIKIGLYYHLPTRTKNA